MNPYKVVVSKSASKELHKLPLEVNNKIISSLLKLEENPRPSNAKNSKVDLKIGEFE